MHIILTESVKVAHLHVLAEFTFTNTVDSLVCDAMVDQKKFQNFKTLAEKNRNLKFLGWQLCKNA